MKFNVEFPRQVMDFPIIFCYILRLIVSNYQLNMYLNLKLESFYQLDNGVKVTLKCRGLILLIFIANCMFSYKRSLEHVCISLIYFN